MPDADAWLTAFETDGLLRREGASLRTTKRWQAAMMRAALRLYGAAREDLRAPIAAALFDFYGDEIDDESLADAVCAMLPIEAAELQLDSRPAADSGAAIV